MTGIASLQTDRVWHHFSRLCEIPRGSGGEAAVSDMLRDFGLSLGLDTRQDALGNVVIRKPGTSDAPAVALQAHMDMVWQKTPGSPIDFATDPITPVIDGDWLRADGTTLGADNGIGVAMAMAVLEDPGLVHPPLEVILTVDEEVGMSGAESIGPEDVEARQLINLDSEDDAALTIGCAGAIDLIGQTPVPTTPMTPGAALYCLRLSGGNGGHSGLEIDRNGLNAIVLLAKAAKSLGQIAPLELLSFDVPGVANVIPGQGQIVFAVAPQDGETLERRAGDILKDLCAPFSQTDPEAKFHLSSAEGAGPVLTPAARDALIDALIESPNGVLSRSGANDALVESSSNLAVCCCANGRVDLAILLRSSDNTKRVEIADQIISRFQAADLQLEATSNQPAWQPQPGTTLEQAVVAAYEAQSGRRPQLDTIHAGLECGCFAAAMPEMKMISIGPNIRGAHSPEEKVQISSTAFIWSVLIAALEGLAAPSR